MLTRDQIDFFHANGCVWPIPDLNEDVFEDAYRQEPWAVDKPGWSQACQALIEQMLACRAGLGFEVPAARATLSFGQGGFSFAGSPGTPLGRAGRPPFRARTGGS